MAKISRNEKSPTVLAFEKKLVPSDGFFYGTNWEKRHSDCLAPLPLLEKSVRGTISNRLKKALLDDTTKLNAAVENPNLQKIDSCALNLDHDTLKIHFTLKVLSNVEKPSACNNAKFKENYALAARKYIEEEGFYELAKRYAINIASARFLWRNRVGAENIEVIVKVLNHQSQTNQIWTFNSQEFCLDNFETSDAQIKSLAEKIAQALCGKQPFLLLDINAFAKLGCAQEVYPSEELVLDKGNSKSKKSKILYHINGIAGMHSQKIGNALRSVDTWYPDYETVTTGPIAIEPYGAVTNLGIAYRHPKTQADFFTLFDKFAWGEKLATKEEEHYVMAVLIRGGVFGEKGESSKEE